MEFSPKRNKFEGSFWSPSILIGQSMNKLRNGRKIAIFAAPAMNSLLVSAASGMKARMDSLDMLANNVANTGTSGFKADREFYSIYQSQLPVVQSNWTDLSQGTFTPTANPLDLAISGPGFFALTSPNGVVYTRSGHFRISKANELVSPDGFPLRDALGGGKPIVIDPLQPFTVEKSGSIMQSGQTIGKIQIEQIPSAASAFSKLGKTYFALSNPLVAPAADQASEVQQGFIEESNVPVADAAVRLITVMRQFEMLQKALNIGAQMDRQAVQEVAKVS